MKVLKASGRPPELETWKQLFSSLEERIWSFALTSRYSHTVSKFSLFCTMFDILSLSPAGTPYAQLPPLPQGSVSDKESYFAHAAAKFGK